jgi:hypothetical protein
MRRGRPARGVMWLALAALGVLRAPGLGVPRAALAEDRPPTAPAAPPVPPAAGLAVVEGFDFDPLPSFASRLQNALPSKRADPAKRQRAIEAALEWLAAHQAPDGSWRPHELGWCRGTQGTILVEGSGKAAYVVGATGAALAAFLLVGIGPFADHPQAATVRKALEFLRASQDAEGCFGPRNTQHYVYNHAFACLALLEAYGMTGESSLGHSARNGIAFCLLSQNPGAGWRYGVRPGDSDTSATVAMGACLSVAHAINEGVLAAGGIDPVPFPDEAVHGMHAWFDRMTNFETGRAGYINRGGGSARTQEMVDKFPAEHVEPMTAGALLLRRMLPPPVAPPVGLEARGVSLLRAVLPEWSVERGTIDFLHWYYGTLALSVVGGPAWEEWDTALGTALLASQRTDGTICDVRGSWDAADPWGPDGGRIYSTAFGVLSLAGANRYRPITRADLANALRTKGLAPHLQALAARAISALGLELDETLAMGLARSPSAEVRSAAPLLLARGAVRDGPLQMLMQLLADPSADVRSACLRAVDAAEPWRARLVEPLWKLVSDARVDLGTRALAALRHAGAAAAPLAPKLAPLLAHADPGLQAEAVRCLWRLGADRAALRERVTKTLTQGPPEERRRTLAALEPAEVAAEGLTDAVRACLAGEAPGVAVAAARLLRDAPADVAATLDAATKALAAPHPGTRLAALAFLATSAPGTALPFETVAPLAVTGPIAVRLEAVRVLARATTPTPLAYVALTSAAAQGHAPLAKAADAALAQLAVPVASRARLFSTALLGVTTYALRHGAWLGFERLGAEGVPPLRELVRNSALVDEARAELVALLGRLGRVAKPALPEVLQVLETDGSDAVRRAAAEALGEPGISDVSAVGPVARGIGSPDEVLSTACVRALIRLARREPSAAAEVDRLLGFKEKTPPRPAEIALQELRFWPEAAARVTEALLRLLGYEDGTASWGAAGALAPLGAQAVKLLLPLIAVRPGEQDTRLGMALRTLEMIGREAEPAVPRLLVILTDFEWESAADALGAIGKPAVSGLVRALASEKARVRALAARGLGRAGPEASSAASALKRALKDDDAEVRKEAEAALRRVKP